MELGTLNEAAAAWAPQVIQTIGEAKGIGYQAAALLMSQRPVSLRLERDLDSLIG